MHQVRSRLTKLMVDILEDMSIDHHFTEMDFERIFAACKYLSIHRSVL